MQQLRDEIALEQSYLDQGYRDYQQSLRDNADRKHASWNPYCKGLIARTVPRLAEAIKAELDLKAKETRGRPSAAMLELSRLVDNIGLDEACYLATCAFLDVLGTAEVTVLKTENFVAHRLLIEYRSSYLPKELYLKWESKFNKATTDKRRLELLKYLERREQDRPKLEQSVLAQVGSIFVQHLVKLTGVVDVIKPRFQEDTYTFKASKAWLNYIDEYRSHHEKYYARTGPTLIPPKPWSNVADGGYWHPTLAATKPLTKNEQSSPTFYQAVNKLQSTPYRINNPVLSVALWAWENNIAIGKLPRKGRGEEPISPFPGRDPNAFDEFERQTFREFKRDKAMWWEREARSFTTKVAVNRILSTAKQFRDKPEFYYVWYADFRGRLYPYSTDLSPQGTDLGRGLLTFAQGEVIKDPAWLYRFAASCYGKGRLSLKAREQWTLDNREIIQRCAVDPYNEDWWREAKEPWQFLACCVELNSYWSNPSGHISYLPIYIDGTCNGLQHFAALLKDEDLGERVNLTQRDIPADVYTEVLDEFVSLLNDAERTALKSILNRELVKTPVMTKLYAAKEANWRKHILMQLKHSSNVSDIYNVKTKYLTNTLAQLIKAVNNKLYRAVPAMNQLRQHCQNFITSEGRLCWSSPSGFIVTQKYLTYSYHRVLLKYLGRTVKLSRTPLGSNNRKHASSFVANLIHSLDAATLHVFLSRATHIPSLATIHDCIGTHCNYVDSAQLLIKQSFLEVHTDLIKHVEVIPPDLIQGQLDLTRVLQSDYFFS